MPAASPASLDDRVAAVRRFNRFFTRKIGVLREGLLDSPYSLTEVRILYELAQGRAATATELHRGLGLDPGYVSRVLAKFEKHERLVERRRSEEDRRKSHLTLTRKGRSVFGDLDRRSRKEVARLLKGLPEFHQSGLVEAMGRIEAILEPPDAAAPYLIRSTRPGDMGWVIWRHSEVYRHEFGWNDNFAALVARLVADFTEHQNSAVERCWIAEVASANVGCVFLMKETDELARLRMLLVEPSARGLGIGRKLVEQCLITAQEIGYKAMTLWTNDVLRSAGRIYESFGFRIIREERHARFGPEMTGQEWALEF